MDRLLDVDETSTLLSVSRWTLYRWAKLGLVPSVRLGAAKNAPLRFPVRALERWVREQRTRQPAPAA